jgi:spoIIIJ-associated protein
MTETQETKQEFIGKTVEDCLANAAQTLGVHADKLDVEVIDEPGSFSALFGKKARIRAKVKGPSLADEIADGLRFDSDFLPARKKSEPRAAAPRANSPRQAAPRPAADRPTATPAPRRVPPLGAGFDPLDSLTRIANVVMPEAKVTKLENDNELILDIGGDGSGIFIGRKGATLEALQFLMTRMSQKQGWEGKRIVVDSEGYRQRRVETLCEKTEQMAKRVLENRRPLRTELLDAAMRKVVHTEVKRFPELETRSIGTGDLKRVQIHVAGEDEGRSRSRSPRRN